MYFLTIVLSGVQGFLMPPKVQDYCLYFKDGYMGYTFNKQDDPQGGYSPDQYPCPPGVVAGQSVSHADITHSKVYSPPRPPHTHTAVVM